VLEVHPLRVRGDRHRVVEAVVVGRFADGLQRLDPVVDAFASARFSAYMSPSVSNWSTICPVPT
jgi:hypothetical protein